MSKNLKIRLDQLLVNKKLVSSKSKAQSMIMAGQVTVNDDIITKSGIAIKEDSKIIIKKLHPTWVSRGALKLLKAIETFEVKIQNKICLDIGSSTGGFTEVLLKNKAKKIFAIDVGTNHLAGCDVNNTLKVIQTILNDGGKTGKIPKNWDGKAGLRTIDYIRKVDFS